MAKSVYLDRALLESKAFLDVSGIAFKVFFLFLKRRKMLNAGRKKGRKDWVIKNNGEIIFTYKEALEKYGITRPRFRRALVELVEKGFIDINHPGGGMVKDCTKYSISNRWEKYGTDDFIKGNILKDTRGLGFTKKNWEKRTGKKRRPTLIKGNAGVTRLCNTVITKSPKNGASHSNKNVIGKNLPKYLKANNKTLVETDSSHQQ